MSDEAPQAIVDGEAGEVRARPSATPSPGDQASDSEAGAGKPGRSLVVWIVLGGCLLVAIASRELALLVPPLNGDSRSNMQTLGAVAVLLGAGWLLVQRRGFPPTPAGRSDPTVNSIRAAATIMALLAFLAAFNPAPRVTESEGGPGGGGGRSGSAAPGLPPLPTTGSGEVLPAETRGGDSFITGSDSVSEAAGASGPSAEGGLAEGFVDQLGGLMKWVVLIAVLLVMARFFRRRGYEPEEEEPRPELLPPVEPMDFVDEESEEEAAARRGDFDPITNAYHDLIDALSEAGVPRRPEEAPYEHLHRAVPELGVSPEPPHRLARLYVRAQFSERPLTEEHEAAAAEALGGSLESLRRVPRPAKPEAREGHDFR